MSKMVLISDELHEILTEEKDNIKSDFLTLKMFVDSAIRDKLRKRGVDVGDDEIIAHLARLQESNARHINQRALIRKRTTHKRRVARQKQKLDQLTEE